MQSRGWAGIFIIALLYAGAPVRAAPVISTATPYAGVTWYDVTDTAPRNIHYELVQVDLAAAGVSFGLTSGNGVAAGEVVGSTTQNYVAASGTSIGINGGYFLDAGGGNRTMVGLEVAAGAQVSSWQGTGDTRESGINISAANVVTFVTPPAPNTTAGSFATAQGTTLYNAIGGNYMSVKNGVKTGITDDAIVTSRTSVGKKGNFLYFFTVDAGSSASVGLTPVEVGTLLHDTWGLTDVMNLDGGGSTQMAFNSAKGALYVNSPSGSSPRVVGNNFVLKANAAPAGTINTLDDFEASVNGHFNSTITASGSNFGVAASSSAARVTSGAQAGTGAMQLAVNASAGDGNTGWFCRFLSGGGSPDANTVIPTVAGSVGYWLKTTTAGLQASIGVDDGSGLEEGIFRTVVADGQYHFYQWSLGDATQWSSLSAGNGQLDGPGITMDSVLLQTGIEQNATATLDGLVWSNSATIAVPEPGSLAIWVALSALKLGRRRRASTRRPAESASHSRLRW